MKLTVEIPDNKVDFMLELLQNLSFVSVQQDHQRTQRVGKAALIADVKEAIIELNEVLAGRRQARPIEDLINELAAEDEL